MNLQLTAYDAMGALWINLAYSAQDPKTGLYRLVSVGSGSLPGYEFEDTLGGCTATVEAVALWALDQIYGVGLAAPLISSQD